MDDNSKLQFKVDHQHITRTDKRLTIASNTKNLLVAKFTFTDEWIELGDLYATFRKNNKTYSVKLDENMECIVPWEVLIPGRFMIGVFGGDLYTSDGYEVTVEKSVYDDQMFDPMDPTKTSISELLERVESLEKSGGLLDEDSVVSEEEVEKIFDDIEW